MRRITKFYIAHRILTKALLTMAAVFFTASVLVTGFVSEMKEKMREEGAEHLLEIEKQIATNIEKQSAITFSIISSIYDHYKETKQMSSDIFQEIVEKERKRWGFDYLCLIDKEGNYYFSTGEAVDLNFDGELKTLLLKNKPIVSKIENRKDGNNILFAMPISPFEWDGYLIQALGIGYHTDRLMELLDVQAFDGSASFYVLRENGIPLFRSINADGISEYNLLPVLRNNAKFLNGSVEKLRKSLEKRETGVMEYKMEGKEFYLCYLPIELEDWCLIMTLPNKIVNRGMMLFLRRTLVVGGGIILTLVIMVLVIFYFINKTEIEKRNRENIIREGANKEKNKFLSSISHDIRIPLNAVMGLTIIASANIDDKDKVKSSLHKISLSSKHVLSLINDLIDMTSMENGKMTIVEEPVSIPEVVDEAVTIIELSVKEKNQELSISFLDLVHKKIIGDKLRLNQIFINILSSCVKYTPEDGKISFTIKEIPAKEEGYAHFQFRFSNNGEGMEQEIAEKIFELFTREQDSKFDHIQGEGIGMAITKNIVDLMGGKIEVKSAPGEGGTFFVEMSFKIDHDAEQKLEYQDLVSIRMSASKKKEIMSKDKDFSSKCILIVEDNEMNREISAAILGETGLKVFTASDGAEAVEIVNSSPEGKFDLILMDIQMPKLDGYDATRKIRSLDRTDVKQIPIIAMTGNVFTEDISAAYAAGMNKHLAKPMDLDKVMKTLEEFLFYT